MKSKLTVRDLAFMAMYVAIFIVLDYVTQWIPFLQMPQGGSIGVGTVALLLASYHLEAKKGLMVACISIPLQYFTGTMYIAGLPGLFLDYVLAFGIYGIACVFPNWGYFYSGILIANFIRFVCHVLSGMICYETPLWGSITYNAPYMIATCIVGLLLVPLLHKRLAKIR